MPHEEMMYWPVAKAISSKDIFFLSLAQLAILFIRYNRSDQVLVEGISRNIFCEIIFEFRPVVQEKMSLKY